MTEQQNRFIEKVNNLNWLAGFWDGEGCLYYNPSLVKKKYKGKDYSYPCVQAVIGQSGDIGKEVCEAFQIVHGFGKISTSHGSGLNKLVPYMTRLHGQKAVKFIKLLEPYLALKREKTQLIIKEMEFYYD